MFQSDTRGVINMSKNPGFCHKPHAAMLQLRQYIAFLECDLTSVRDLSAQINAWVLSSALRLGFSKQ